MRNVGLTFIVAITLGSCSWFDLHESVRKGELRFQSPDVVGTGQPSAPDCGHLYNNGNSDAWAECMGVGRK